MCTELIKEKNQAGSVDSHQTGPWEQSDESLHGLPTILYNITIVNGLTDLSKYLR